MDHAKRLVRLAKQISESESRTRDLRRARNEAIAAAIHDPSDRDRLTERHAAQAAGVSYAWAGRCARSNGKPPSGRAVKAA